MKYKLGFIGCGNMGGALLRAVAKSLDGSLIAVCEHNREKIIPYALEFGIQATTARELAENAEFIILGVKPQAMRETLSEISDILQTRKNAIIITMAAGLSISTIRAFIGSELPVIRIMPNTPVAVGSGMILYAMQDVSREIEKDFLNLFCKAGVFDKLPENQMNAACALSGCGPAFVYAFAQALAQGGEECGLDKEKAALYAAQTLRGAADMLLEFKNSETLKNAVCSKGGATIEGIKHLEKNDLHSITVGAVQAAYKRTLELT